MTKRFWPLLLTTAFLASCGGDDASEAEEAAQDGAIPAEAMGGLGQAFQPGAAGNAAVVEAVDAKVLQAHLPDELAGLNRVSSEAMATGSMGMNMSSANARYENPDGANLTVTIMDYGAMGEMGLMSMAAWAMATYERTTDTGYERTTTFEGYKGMETLNRDGDNLRGELNLIVGNRFLVTLQAYQVEMDAIHDAARGLELDDLADEG